MTNREWLQSLSNEDFSLFVGNSNSCDCCTYNHTEKCLYAKNRNASKADKENHCKLGIVEWLEKEVEEE